MKLLESFTSNPQFLNQLFEAMDQYTPDLSAEADPEEQLTKLGTMFDAARRALGLVNKLEDGETKQRHKSRVFSNLNKLRAASNRILKAIQASLNVEQVAEQLVEGGDKMIPVADLEMHEALPVDFANFTTFTPEAIEAEYEPIENDTGEDAGQVIHNYLSSTSEQWQYLVDNGSVISSESVEDLRKMCHRFWQKPTLSGLKQLCSAWVEETSTYAVSADENDEYNAKERWYDENDPELDPRSAHHYQ